VASLMFTAIGLMSGTSLDGVDAALIRTDGEKVERTDHCITVPYDGQLRKNLHSVINKKSSMEKGELYELIEEVEEEVTLRHVQAVRQLLLKAGLTPKNIDIIGFHGQTIDHRPEQQTSWQIGDGNKLAKMTGINVVNNFRAADLKAGGQGAPLVPVYHAALVKELPKPLVFVNIGGVANVTYISDDGIESIMAFDTGPGNALIDDWMLQNMGLHCDTDGNLARSGEVSKELLSSFMDNQYFKDLPPKSLDRNQFSDVIKQLEAAGVSAAQGAATLAAFTVESIVASKAFFKQEPKAWYICGGGRHNAIIMEGLARRLEAKVFPVEEIGLNGDSLEAECFGYLAMRSMRKLPITFQNTTGIKMSSATGGVFCPAGTAPAA